MHYCLIINNLGRKSGAELAVDFACIPATVTTLDLGWNDRKRASDANKLLSEYIKQKDNGAVEVEKLLRVLSLGELKALHFSHFEGVKSLMTTCPGLHNPLSEIVSTSKQGISTAAGNFPDKMMSDLYPGFFCDYLWGDKKLGNILKKCYDERMSDENGIICSRDMSGFCCAT